MKILFVMLALLWAPPVLAAPLALGHATLVSPTVQGTMLGPFALSGGVTAPTPAAGDNSQALSTTAFVAAAIATENQQIAQSYCALAGCSFSGGGGTVSFSPWNWQGYNALSIGNGAFLTWPGNNDAIGIGYNRTSDSSYEGLIVGRFGWTFVDHGLFFLSQSTPSSSTASCDQGAVSVDSSYLYYCVSSNHWGRIGWVTSGW